MILWQYHFYLFTTSNYLNLLAARSLQPIDEHLDSNSWIDSIVSSRKTADGSEFVPLMGGMTQVDGWHTIQFAGGKNSPTKFNLNLIWSSNTTHPRPEGYRVGSDLLLKLRTDVNTVTPKVARVLEKLPPWCALYGKSTSPFTLAFLTSLPVQY